jgi:hypothetical protein
LAQTSFTRPFGGKAKRNYFGPRQHWRGQRSPRDYAAQELSHALIIAKQIDYLGGMPAVEAKTVRTSEKATQMLQFDLDNETKTIRNYRERVRQCEELAEYAMGEQIHEILIGEQDDQPLPYDLERYFGLTGPPARGTIGRTFRQLCPFPAAPRFHRPFA